MKRARTRVLVAVVVAAGLAVGVLLGVVASAIITNRDAANNARAAAAKANQAIHRIEQESFERRDQSCRLSERDHLQDVQQLRRTYRYLLHPGEFGDRKGSDLYGVVLAQLAKTERDARVDRAPPFCDEPGIGLPEPDPVLPKRPRELNP